MTLQQELDDFRKNSPHKFSPEDRANMDRFKDSLAETTRAIPTVGEKAPAFSLLDTMGATVSSTELLEKKDSLFLVFFRGSW